MAQAVGKVWALSPTFRAETSDTPRHLSEFYMLEAEMAFVEKVEDVMDLVQDMIRHITTEVSSSAIGDQLLASRGRMLEDAKGGDTIHEGELTVKVLQARWTGILNSSWPRVTYHTAMNILQSAVDNGSVKFQHAIGPETGLQTEHERYIATHLGKGGPVFVTDYPASMKPFYMPASTFSSSQDLGPVPTVACFDLLFPDVCEVVGGSLREHRLSALQDAMRERGVLKGGDGVAENSLEWYLDLRRYGSVPHGGFGMGFDRLLGYVSGVGNIRDVVAFPRYYGKCLC